MKTFKALIGEVIGMFVDDGSLAFAILGMVAAAYALSIGLGERPYLLGGILYVGCLIILVENILRTARQR